MSEKGVERKRGQPFSIDDLLFKAAEPSGDPEPLAGRGDAKSPRAKSPVAAKRSKDDSKDDSETEEAREETVSPPVLVYPRAGSSLLLSPVVCRLEGQQQWRDFHRIDTEMIITKSGRRMFPALRVSFLGTDSVGRGTGLGPGKWEVLVDIVAVDRKRYRYAYHKSSWLVAGKADPPSPHRLYRHPDSPFSSDQLTKQPVSFEKLKLTNNELDRSGNVIILNSMHKYQPRVHLVRWEDGRPPLDLQKTDLEREEMQSFVFPETQFMAVTAYQNQLVTKMKIDSNPFAKGFRDSSRLCDFEGRDGAGYGEGPGGAYAAGLYRYGPPSTPQHLAMMQMRAAALFSAPRGPDLRPGGLQGLPGGLGTPLLHNPLLIQQLWQQQQSQQQHFLQHMLRMGGMGGGVSSLPAQSPALTPASNDDSAQSSPQPSSQGQAAGATPVPPATPKPLRASKEPDEAFLPEKELKVEV